MLHGIDRALFRKLVASDGINRAEGRSITAASPVGTSWIAYETAEMGHRK